MILERQGVNPHKRIDELEKRVAELEKMVDVNHKQTSSDSRAE